VDTVDAGTPDGGPLEVEAGYRELRAVYEREYPADNGKQYDQASRNAYARMRAAGVPHEQIIAGAREWVQAYVEGQGVGFLPRLPDWLTCRHWEHEPWQKRRKAAQSKPDRRSLRYAKKDLAREALKHGGYREDANGNLYHPDDFAVAGAVQ
jgi:hypothetical protein